MHTPPFHPIVCLLATLLLLTGPPAPSAALSWPHQQWPQQHPQKHAQPDVHDSKDQTSHDSFARDDVVSVEEMYTLQHATDALKAYDSKPDCFKDAARALRQGCKSIDIDEDEKTRYAIRLTACEIATANMPVPQECHSLASVKNDPDQQLTSNDISRCVQSMGRVPQLWTSYSGYFREVKVMCLAVRYSLEHDDLRRLQRNLSRTQTDQIKLLKEQQRILTETNRLETDRLKELSELYSTITTQVNSMLNSAGTLKDVLLLMTEEVSKLTQSIEKGVLQQDAALSTTQESNARILAEHQDIVHSTLLSVSQSMHQWHDSLQLGLYRAQEIDLLNQDAIAKIAHSNEALHSLHQQTQLLKLHLQNLTHLSHEGTHQLLGLHTTATQQITASTSDLLQSTLQSLHTLSSQTHLAWSTMLDTLKDDTLTEFRTDVAQVLGDTVEEIEKMARESRDKIERLNRVVEGFWRDQEDVLGRVRPLLGSWSVVKRVLEGKNIDVMGGKGGVGGGYSWIGGTNGLWRMMGSGFVALFFVVVAGLTVAYGLRTALPMVASVAITIFCEWCKLPTVPFIHLFMGIICFRWLLNGVRSWYHYYHTRHQFLLWQFCVHLWDRWRDLRKIDTQGADAADQEQEWGQGDQYQVDDGYEDVVRDHAYGARSYLDQDRSEEEEEEEEKEDLEMERLSRQQEDDYDDDNREQQTSACCNVPLALEAPLPSASAPSTFRPKMQQYRPLCCIEEKPFTKPSAEMWEEVIASWDLALGTCVNSSTTNDIY